MGSPSVTPKFEIEAPTEKGKQQFEVEAPAAPTSVWGDIKNRAMSGEVDTRPFGDVQDFYSYAKMHPWKALGKAATTMLPLAASFIGAPEIEPINVKGPGEVMPEMIRPRAYYGGQPVRPIPSRSGLMLPGEVAPPPITEAIPRPTQAEIMPRVLKSNPSALAEAPTPPARIIDQASGLGNIGSMASPQGSELQYRPQPVGESINMKRFEKSNPSALGKITTSSERGQPPITMGNTPSGTKLVPEPREEFPGEDPNYMASVPRNRLSSLAVRGKPGAGRQLQQLGEPIIYVPRSSLP